LMIYICFKMIYSGKQFIPEIGNTSLRTALIMVLFLIFKKTVDLYTERTVQKTTPFAIWMFLGALIVWFL